MIYHVPVTRSESVTREFSVSAESWEEAKQLAIEKACNYEWPRGNAEYEAEKVDESYTG